ncbi:hypothetical protein BBJ29_004861 [Phytophthora kernoviae]|nr:hypothetical protein BBJ29_004861 [Phytophthora kernoviae]
MNAFVNNPPKWSLLETYEHTKSLHCMRLLKSPATEQLYRDWEFDEVTTLTASRGDLHALAWLVERYLLDGRLAAAANAAARRAEAAALGAQRGHKWEIVKWVATHYNISSLSVCVDDAAKDGDLEFLQWTYPQVPAYTFSEAVASSAGGGHLKVLKWLSEVIDELPLTAECIDQAASGGHLEVWLHSNRAEGCTISAMNRAAENDHLEVVKWMHAMRNEGCSVSAMEKAAGNGHLEIVKWLHLHRSEGCTERAMDWAAQGGHLDVVKWLHVNRSEGCTSAAMNWAAGNGHLQVIMWLHHNRTEGCTYSAMDLAAGSRHLDVLKWLHENQIEGFSVSAMDMAAAGGYLRVLQWLHANGSEAPSPNAMRDATLFGHVPVMLFLYNEYGHEYSEAGICSLSDAWEDVKIRSVVTAQWLLKTFGERLDGVVFRVHRADWPTNKWLRNQNVSQLEVEDKFVFWECGEAISPDHDNGRAIMG